MTASGKLIVLASGGTGGHVFPAQALAEELIGRGYRLAFVTDRRADSYGLAVDGVETLHISAAGVSGRGPIGKIAAAAKLGIGYLQARRILQEKVPAVVVGFGGYPTVPTLMAASRIGLKTVIHEQNAVLGRANRLLAPGATRIATAFKTTSYLRNADRSRTVWTGNPVRPAFLDVRERPYPTLTKGEPIEILVTGGSQGARRFDEVIPRAMARLPENLRWRIRIVQQVRKEAIEAAARIYENVGITAELASFFTDIPDRVAKAHLVICRAGASTMAEITTAGRPAILVPYPFATDDHQTVNATRLCDAGGGWMIPDSDFTAETLMARLVSLLAMEATLSMAARCAAQIGVPEATRRLADVVAGVIGTNGDSLDRSVVREEAA